MAIQDSYDAGVGFDIETVVTGTRMESTVKTCREVGSTANVIMGGAPVTKDYARKIQADGCGSGSETVGCINKGQNTGRVLCHYDSRC